MEPETKVEKEDKSPLWWSLLQFVLSVGLILILGGKLLAQSCAMCYTTAAAGSSSIIHALKSGIVILLFPAVGIFIGLILLIFRWQSTNA
jgi:hypothetical protein